ncbi:hypothetical protein BDF20DRAFT_847828 [Mycotypha africana]|uniref:uncharacterized protein n=1 Tax=Mycotypha africana TaxID=64632 RepID=UPI0023010270|nr:uncharacterized protein BDF20DRAFT_847828 [Mycotypha africana]KAI8992025.1 hypothetical protein BDF20DRAFT_847828 [Mycotypha africana]
MAEDAKTKLKLDDLKKRYREVETENDLLQEKLHKARKNIKRLRLERSLLLERLEKGYTLSSNNEDSDTNSDEFLESGSHHHHKVHHYSLLNNKPNANNIKPNSASSSVLYSSNNSKPTTTTVIKPPKKKKDPNAPKGPGNVFFLYCRFERDKIKDENPDESVGDVTKILAHKWRALPKEEKKFYYDIFNKEMREYEEAMKTYKLTGVNIMDNNNASTQQQPQPQQHSASIDNSKAAVELSSVSSPVTSTVGSPEADSSILNHDEEDEDQIVDDDMDDVYTSTHNPSIMTDATPANTQ